LDNYLTLFIEKRKNNELLDLYLKRYYSAAALIVCVAGSCDAAFDCISALFEFLFDCDVTVSGINLKVFLISRLGNAQELKRQPSLCISYGHDLGS
jgi:hypothetical protein